MRQAAAAAERVQRLGYERVHVRAGDGREGWPEHAPYDGIIVTAAGRELPPALLDQLASPGRLVAPVGRGPFGQELIVIDKSAGGETTEREVLPVAFVLLTGGRPCAPRLPRRGGSTLKLWSGEISSRSPALIRNLSTARSLSTRTICCRSTSPPMTMSNWCSESLSGTETLGVAGMMLQPVGSL